MLHCKPRFKPLLFMGGGGGNSLVKMTVNSKEKNSYDFCPKYVQEIVLCILYIDTRNGHQSDPSP